MGKVINSGDIVIVNDEKIYAIKKTFEYLNKTFAIATELDENMLETNENNNPDIVMEEVVEGEDVYMKPITEKLFSDYLLDTFWNDKQ